MVVEILSDLNTDTFWPKRAQVNPHECDMSGRENLTNAV